MNSGNEKLTNKCKEVIDLLSDLSVEEKYRVIASLYDSLLDVCEKEGIHFMEITKK